MLKNSAGWIEKPAIVLHGCFKLILLFYSKIFLLIIMLLQAMICSQGKTFRSS